jgi:membrane protease YdiL (CAAX protease family)
MHGETTMASECAFTLWVREAGCDPSKEEAYSHQMKKCPYCGKEYPDEVVRCLTDGEVLAGGEPDPAPSPPEIGSSEPPPAIPPVLSTNADAAPGRAWTDRETRIIEVALVCLIAFGGSILTSAHHFYRAMTAGLEVDPALGASTYGAWSWANSGLHEGASLGLLWYVLTRRSRTFCDLGLSWARRDFGWSILLFLGGSLASSAVYEVIAAAGLTSPSTAPSGALVSHYLFGGGVTIATMLFQFLNPFFEELIARAYVMTELRQLTNSLWKPIVFSTLLQTSYHFYQGAPMALSHGAMFLLFSIYYCKTQRIWPIILAHLYCDVGNALFYWLPHH